MNSIQKEILNTIDIIADKKIEEIQLDKTIIAKITAHPTPSQNLYRIQYQGLTYDAFSSTNESYTVSDSVLVLVPNNQFSNKKIILMKEPKTAEALVTSSGGGSSGTGTVGVTQVSVVTANGFAGTVANSSSTASITLTTTITGVLKGNGTALSAATTTGTGSIVLSDSATMSTTSFTGQIISTMTTGVSPFTVASTTKVTNLNADLLDDQTGTYYLDYNNFTNTPSIGNGLLTLSTSGLGLSGGTTFTANTTSPSTFTVTSNATSSNVVSTIVGRDASGGFFAATITASNLNATNQFISTVTTGTAPLVVASTTKVTNLNTDYLDGSSSEYYLNYNNLINTPTIGDGALTLATSGLGLSGSTIFSANTTSPSAFTVTSNATSSNVASTIMARSSAGSVSTTDLTLSGQGLFAAGSVGAPSISFSADTNTGVYSPTADTIGFVENGSEVIRIDSSGRLLTGLTAPLGSTGNSLVHARQGFSAYNDGSTAPFFQSYHGSASLDLKTWRHGGDSSGNYQFQTVNDAYSAANNRVTMYNTGEVGIGTTAPLSKLHVNANTGTPAYTVATSTNLNITGADAAANVLELDSFAGVSQVIGRRANTTLASPTAVGGNTNMLILASRPYNGTAYSTTDTARIAFNTNGAQTTTASAGNIIFSNVTTGTTSLVEAMRITGPQELLIGYSTSNTTATSFKLQVNSQIFATSGTIATSDGNYKENVEPLTDSLNIINSLNPVSFNWKQHPVHNFDLSTKTVGFIAQEVQEVLKDKPYVNSIIKQNQSIYQDSDGNEIVEPFLGIAEGNLIAILTRAIQEQQQQINDLKYEIDQLKTMVQ